MTKPNPEDYEYVEVEVDEEEEEEEQEEEQEIEVDNRVSSRIGAHPKKEKAIKSFADLAMFNRNTEKLKEEAQARGEDITLTLIFPDKSTQQLKVPLHVFLYYLLSVQQVPVNQTVEYVKSIIETRYGIDYTKMVFFLSFLQSISSSTAETLIPRNRDDRSIQSK